MLIYLLINLLIFGNELKPLEELCSITNPKYFSSLPQPQLWLRLPRLVHLVY